MKKLFLILGVVSCLTAGSYGHSHASLSTTFLGYSGCTCTDNDNWIDALTPSSVSLSCPGAAAVTFHDALATSVNTIKEYSCGGIVGGVTVINDPLSQKPMVSYANKTCPKGYSAVTVSKTGLARDGMSATKITQAYCKKQSLTTSVSEVK